MSGDVQPRKRKDKKRKKDELGVEEPRGTAAVLGEGDVFMHSQHDHGTGGHWCAKIIFFSLLAVLITLVGLIILENRGLTDLEANSVESRYSGVLEGWLEDAPDDDHHDEHTLELKHDTFGGHDDDVELSQEVDQDEEEHSDEHDQAEDDNDDDEIDQDDEQDVDDDYHDDQDDNDDARENEDDINTYEDDEVTTNRRYMRSARYADDDENDNDDEDDDELYKGDENDSIEDDNEKDQEDDEEESTEQNEGSYDRDFEDEHNIKEGDEDKEQTEDDGENTNKNENVDDDTKEDDDNSNEQDESNTYENEDEEQHDGGEHDNEEQDSGVLVEKLEKEISDEDILSSEEQTRDETTKIELANEASEDVSDDDDDEEEYLELDDIDEPLPVVEHIKVPAGKPLTEIEEDTVSEKPPDTLAEEEEYEKRQEELRRERAEASNQDGGNGIEEDWPGEPSDSYWRQQLDQAEEELRQGKWSSASRLAGVAELNGSARAKWLLAQALDSSAEARRDNALLSQAITAYLDLLKMNQRLDDEKLLKITERTLDRIRFRGNYLSAEPIYRLLIRRFPDVPDYRNNLTVTFLMANRADLAEDVIKETLIRWPDDRVALAHYGFVLKTQNNRLQEAVDAFQKALKDDVGPATEPRFYYHLGDALLLLGRYAEAHEVHKRGAALGHFLSPAQRSLYNVEQLKSQPWWNIEQTPYVKLARALEKAWKQILKEGEAIRSLYEKEKEGLKERGEWTQLDLFVRGQEIPNRCKRAPVTCSIVRAEPAAAGCRRGQVKFSLMEAGTHVRPHVGPTNCRLRMHLGLSNTKDTYIRVDQETRQWVTGKVFMFDDSFEHEVWHNGTGARLVLIVDVWHPDLTPAQRRSLPAI